MARLFVALAAALLATPALFAECPTYVAPAVAPVYTQQFRVIQRVVEQPPVHVAPVMVERVQVQRVYVQPVHVQPVHVQPVIVEAPARIVRQPVYQAPLRQSAGGYSGFSGGASVSGFSGGRSNFSGGGRSNFGQSGGFGSGGVINALSNAVNSPAGQFALGAFVGNGFRFGR